VQGGIEETSCDGDVRFNEVTAVRQNSPRKFMLSCIMVIRRRTSQYESASTTVVRHEL